MTEQQISREVSSKLLLIAKIAAKQELIRYDRILLLYLFLTRFKSNGMDESYIEVWARRIGNGTKYAEADSETKIYLDRFKKYYLDHKKAIAICSPIGKRFTSEEMPSISLLSKDIVEVPVRNEMYGSFKEIKACTVFSWEGFALDISTVNEIKEATLYLGDTPCTREFFKVESIPTSMKYVAETYERINWFINF